MTPQCHNRQSMFFIIQVNLQKFRQEDMTIFINQLLKFIESRSIKGEYCSPQTRSCHMRKFLSFFNR